MRIRCQNVDDIHIFIYCKRSFFALQMCFLNTKSIFDSSTEEGRKNMKYIKCIKCTTLTFLTKLLHLKKNYTKITNVQAIVFNLMANKQTNNML